MNDAALNARKAFNKLLSGKMSKEDFDKNYKNTFHRYIIAAPEKFAGELENINEFTENIKLINYDKINVFYDKDTGFIREGEIEKTYFF